MTTTAVALRKPKIIDIPAGGYDRQTLKYLTSKDNKDLLVDTFTAALTTGQEVFKAAMTNDMARSVVLSVGIYSLIKVGLLDKVIGSALQGFVMGEAFVSAVNPFD